MLPTDNPFAAPSELPLHFPPFDRIREEHYRPAIEQGMAEQRAEVAAIGSNPEAPTFANTLEALERSGRLLDRVLSVFYNLVSSDSTDSLLALEGEVSPMLAAHQDAIHLDAALFARIDAAAPGPGRRWPCSPSSCGCSSACTPTSSAPVPPSASGSRSSCGR